MDAVLNGTETSAQTARRRPRTGKKRLKFGPPAKFPRGVRELWKSATAEEQTRAHQACVQILALWLGKRRREEVASELLIPGLRVWQMSQQALSGMLAGLLHQPRPRRRNEDPTMKIQDDDPRLLRKQIAERDRKIADQEDLIRLLTSIPKPRSETTPASEASAPPTKTRASRAARKREEGRGDLSLDASAPAR
jgi:hypothetical protein